jgi:hypothetical protein
MFEMVLFFFEMVLLRQQNRSATYEDRLPRDNDFALTEMVLILSIMVPVLS